MYLIGRFNFFFLFSAYLPYFMSDGGKIETLNNGNLTTALFTTLVLIQVSRARLSHKINLKPEKRKNLTLALVDPSHRCCMYVCNVGIGIV